MIREDRFVHSRRPYAVAMGTVEITSEYERNDGTKGCRAQVQAAWFRGKASMPAACLGLLWDYQDAEPADAEAFLLAHKDGRYGGDCRARWDGTNLWCLEDETFRAWAKGILVPMLAEYPEAPTGFRGWWRF